MKWMLAVDIVDPAAPALVDEAARWAARAGATLDLLHAEGTRYAYEFVTDATVRDLVAAEADRLRAEDRRRLTELLHRIPEPQRGVARIRPGRPVSVLVDEAEPYDTVLVGTHGRTGLQHFWLGSVAEQVVRRCPRPVLVLRIGETGAR